MKLDWEQHFSGWRKYHAQHSTSDVLMRQAWLSSGFLCSCRIASILFAATGQVLRSQLSLTNDTEAAVLLYQAVPKLFYFVSAAAFFSAFVQNCCALIYEAGSTKKQLALVSCFIKGLSAYVDLLLATGVGVVILDSAGNP